MEETTAGMADRTNAAPANFGADPLLELPDGKIVDLATGYIPLLARFTFEDKAAKGLRKRSAGQNPEPPIHFSALELVRDNRFLLLTGPSGSGKTTFAKHLCFQLANVGFKDTGPLLRNELGDVHQELWDREAVLPFYFGVDGPECLETLVRATLPALIAQAGEVGTLGCKTLLFMLDGIETAGMAVPDLLVEICGLFRSTDTAKLVILSETTACSSYSLPADIIRHELLPLLGLQRAQTVSKLLGFEVSDFTTGTGAVAANPALFSLAIQARHPGDTAEELLDAWLAVAFPQRGISDALARQAYAHICNETSSQERFEHIASVSKNPAVFSNVVQQLLAARHLASLAPDAAVELFRRQPKDARTILRSCLVRLSASDKFYTLVEALLGGTPSEAQRGALLVADVVRDNLRFRDSIRNLVLDIVTQGTLSTSERQQAGRILSRLGDPRDFMGLARIPQGSFCMGSESHPNSRPVERIFIEGFQISLHPVVNQNYLTFVRETGRQWLSPDATDAERLNAPATDLTWHDARAYCSWLTDCWRANGTISPDEQVRLPTEPEWERAARGDQNAAGIDEMIYPWGTTWKDDASNTEETGLNVTCAVGIFPQGRSQYGCYDMAGHIWEWCSTVWGEDPAIPFFKGPWRADGREALNSPEPMRRVLRGGCFSSPKSKANCTYRGSLEPSGSWRGNGFRFVVAPIDP